MIDPNSKMKVGIDGKKFDVVRAKIIMPFGSVTLGASLFSTSTGEIELNEIVIRGKFAIGVVDNMKLRAMMEHGPS